MLNFPKIDLHHHFDGALRPQSLLREARLKKHPQGNLTDQDFLSRCRVSPDCNSLSEFLATFEFFYSIASDVDFLSRAANEVVEDLENDGVIYCETRFAPHLFVQPGNISELIQKILNSFNQSTSGKKIKIRLILCIMRSMPASYLDELIEIFPDFKNEGLAGLDLAGDESRFSGIEYIDSFKKASTAEIPVTIHAGEAAGPESVKMALDNFHAVRIGHGVRSLEDPKMTERLATEQIPLEVCLTSNVQTGIFKTIGEHSFLKLLNSGINVTLNTDDPSVSGITLGSELELARKTFLLSEESILNLQKNSVKAAFCDNITRQTLLDELVIKNG